MSAFIVDRDTIDLLITAGLEFAHGSGIRWNASASNNSVDYRPRTLDYNVNGSDLIGADAAGCMLWAENLASVAYRYPNDVSGERPGPNGFEDVWTVLYTFNRIPGNVRALTVLSELSSYEYQSCEHPGWESSEAKRYCDALRKAAIHRLPGYDAEHFTGRDHFIRSAVR